ncbi:MAG: pyrroline-5-carboxylate reductase [Spirochaetales bacterium]|nr:pyrroline-5-carboxylate reductase [Spirochaetales bacterium]
MKRTGFIGAGNMAFAIAGAISDNDESAVIVPYDIDKERLSLFEKKLSHVELGTDPLQVVNSCDVTFLAVKPQVMAEVIAPLKDTSGLIVSIAAGIPISFFEKAMPKARVVRVMPNTPSLVSEMAAGYTPGQFATKKDMALVRSLLETAGKVVKVREELMDGVTGLSGSGPAFFAIIAEAFMEAGTDLGLNPEFARVLTLQTMKGTAMLMEEKDMLPRELVNMVSSPNGTTVAGREIMESSDIKKIIKDTVKRAAERSRELGE